MFSKSEKIQCFVTPPEKERLDRLGERMQMERPAFVLAFVVRLGLAAAEEFFREL